MGRLFQVLFWGALILLVSAFVYIVPGLLAAIGLPLFQIEYQGQRFVQQHWNADGEFFALDPYMFTEAQWGEIRSLLKSAPAPRSFATEEDRSRFMRRLKFPAYGAMSSGVPTPHGLVFIDAIEIPWAGEDRVLVYLRDPQRGGFELLDDFIADARYRLMFPRTNGDRLEFLDHDEQTVLRSVNLVQRDE